mgnify:CR=1 FL=1
MTKQVSPSRLLHIIHAQQEMARAGPDLGKLMTLATRAAQTLLKAQGATFELEEKNDMVYRASCGIAKNALGLRLPIQGSLSGHVIKTGKSYISQNCFLDPKANRLACQSMGILSMIIVPILFKQKPLAVLKVVSNRTNFFSEEDIAYLELLAQTLSNHIHYAIYHQQGNWQYKATHDHLTTLPNRAAFFERVKNLSQKSPHTFIVMVDMDKLKTINDNFGHLAGDAVLQELATRLKSLPSTYQSFRLGGDEFALLIDATTQDEEEMLGQIKELEGNVLWEGELLPVELSLGGVFFNAFDNISDLLHQADQKMYDNKSQKKK